MAVMFSPAVNQEFNYGPKTVCSEVSGIVYAVRSPTAGCLLKANRLIVCTVHVGKIVFLSCTADHSVSLMYMWY